MDKKLDELRGGLRGKQLDFANYYIETGNGTESALRAGYSEHSARIIAAENLAKPNIKAYIDYVMSQKNNKMIADQDEILSFFTSLMRGNEDEEIVCPDGVGGIFRQRKELDPKTRLAAAKELAKRYGIDKPLEKEVDSNITIRLVTGEEE